MINGKRKRAEIENKFEFMTGVTLSLFKPRIVYHNHVIYIIARALKKSKIVLYFFGKMVLSSVLHLIPLFERKGTDKPFGVLTYMIHVCFEAVTCTIEVQNIWNASSMY